MWLLQTQVGELEEKEREDGEELSCGALSGSLSGSYPPAAGKPTPSCLHCESDTNRLSELVDSGMPPSLSQLCQIVSILQTDSLAVRTMASVSLL